mgnify:FL=1
MNVFRAVIFACVVGMVRGQTYFGNCAAGKYSNEGNLAVCKDCPSGFYQSEAGQGLCVACQSGFYQSAAGQGTCEPCANETASFAGSTLCFNALDMFIYTSQLDIVTREMFINEHARRFSDRCD